MNKKLKSIPKFRSEAKERRFWQTHDSSDYIDWAKTARVRFPKLRPSTRAISLRLPVTLLERIKVAANKRDVPYQSLIKTWLAEKIGTRLPIVLPKLSCAFGAVVFDRCCGDDLATHQPGSKYQ
jgi:predicted DNA binding CopG/RHH family protein